MRKETGTDEEPLVDTTAPLPLRSKRTERQQKKRHQKEAASKQHATIWDLPSELLLSIFTLLRPRDLFSLTLVNHSLRSFIHQEQSRITNTIIAQRYSILTQCFPLPILLSTLDTEAQLALLDSERQSTHLHIHKKPYQHIPTPDIQLICSCLTCMLAWNNLCLLVDFAHFQPHLDKGEPIPIIPRGKNPLWNQTLLASTSTIVTKSLTSPLHYARILELHLDSTVRSITRHANNAGNKRPRFRMTAQDAKGETDGFLERSGPPSLAFPFQRDNYYMLEAYCPNRGWSSEEGGWRYMPRSQHERDVEFVRAWKRRREEGVGKERRVDDREAGYRVEGVDRGK